MAEDKVKNDKELVKQPDSSPEEILKAKKHSGKKEKVAAKPTKTTKKVAPVAKPSKSKRGRKYQQAAQLVERGKQYDLNEAIELLARTSFVKFDASVEVHLPLNVDPKQADQLVRGMVILPHGTGKTQRVAVVTTAANVAKAKQAGADVAGEDDLLESIEKGKIDFDILVATPDVMSKLAKHAKELGPKGLMPNPKSGTVTDDIAKTVGELKGGRTEFRVDPSGIIHQVVGKLSHQPQQLAENIKALLKAVNKAKPSGVKSPYVKKLWLSTSMGPSIKVELKSTK